MNNVVTGILYYAVSTGCVIIEDYFDNEVYDADKGFRDGWLPLLEYDNRQLKHGNMYTIVDKRAIRICTTDSDGDLSSYGFKEVRFRRELNSRVWLNEEDQMPIPNELNKFTITLCEDAHDMCYENRRTFTSKFSAVCDTVNHEKGSVLKVWHTSDCIYGTLLYIDYLANSVDKFNKPYIASRRIIVKSSVYIHKRDLVHEMYTNERFLSYFKTCLKYNEPEITEL